MKTSYEATLSGFICIPRNIIPGLIKEFGLSGFAKYIVLLSQADFDKSHRYFSKIIRDDKEIGKKFGVSSSAIYKSRKKLTESGLLNTEGGVSSFPSMEAFDPKILSASTKKKIAITIEMLKDWKKFDDENKKYVDGLKKDWVKNDG